jgi:hypothetical protein
MRNQKSETLRTFFHSLGIAALITFVFWIAGHRIWSAGFVLGAAMSLFSLFSLRVCVPRLFRAGATGRATTLLHFALVAKLPVYGAGLYLATRMGSAAAFAAFAGCALVPAVITLETVGRALTQSDGRWREAAALCTPIVVLPAVEELARQVAELKAEAAAPLPLPSPGGTVREGAA